MGLEARKARGLGEMVSGAGTRVLHPIFSGSFSELQVIFQAFTTAKPSIDSIDLHSRGNNQIVFPRWEIFIPLRSTTVHMLGPLSQLPHGVFTCGWASFGPGEAERKTLDGLGRGMWRRAREWPDQNGPESQGYKQDLQQIKSSKSKPLQTHL